MVESNSEISETDVKNYFDTSTDYSFIKDCADKNLYALRICRCISAICLYV